MPLPTNDPKEMAAACRRFASTTINQETADFLRALAEEYEELASKGGSPPDEDPKSL